MLLNPGLGLGKGGEGGDWGCGKCPRAVILKLLTLEASKKNWLHKALKGRRVNRTPPPTPFTFDTIHLIDMKFGKYNKLHLYFQISETTWCLIGLHGNNSQINDVTDGRHVGFLNFQILFKFSLLYLKLLRKQHSVVEIHEIARIHCEIVNIN